MGHLLGQRNGDGQADALEERRHVRHEPDGMLELVRHLPASAEPMQQRTRTGQHHPTLCVLIWAVDPRRARHAMGQRTHRSCMWPVRLYGIRLSLR